MATTTVQERRRIIDGILDGIERDAYDAGDIEAAIEAVCEQADAQRWDVFMTGGAAVLAFKNNLRAELSLDE